MQQKSRKHWQCVFSQDTFITFMGNQTETILWIAVCLLTWSYHCTHDTTSFPRWYTGIQSIHTCGKTCSKHLAMLFKMSQHIKQEYLQIKMNSFISHKINYYMLITINKLLKIIKIMNVINIMLNKMMWSVWFSFYKQRQLRKKLNPW